MWLIPLDLVIYYDFHSTKHFLYPTQQLMAQIYRLAKPGTEDSLAHVIDVNHPNDSERRSQVSVNIAKWLPQPGRGFVYGTNRGHLRICTPRWVKFSKFAIVDYSFTVS